jgi:hypothetical protein
LLSRDNSAVCRCPRTVVAQPNTTPATATTPLPTGVTQSTAAEPNRHLAVRVNSVRQKFDGGYAYSAKAGNSSPPVVCIMPFSPHRANQGIDLAAKDP